MKRNLFFTAAHLVAFALLILGNTSLIQAQLSLKQNEEAVAKLIEEFDDTSTPGGAVMVIRDGQVIYEKSFGMANLTHNIPFEISTPTNLGSTTKQFTAFGIALLEEKGLLSVNDDIRKFFPELPDFGDTVRLRHLLSHTSGYREYINSLLMAGRQINDPIRKEEIIMVVQNQPILQNEPGELYNYNNTGYALLSMVIEKVTDEDYDKWMQENVFLPLGMTLTVVRTDPGQIIPGNAQGYIKMDEDTFVEAKDIYASTGAGGIYSTLPDFDTNLFLINKIRESNKKAIIIVVSHQIDEAIELYAKGATYVIMPHFLGGHHASTLIEKHGLNMNKFMEQKVAHIEHLKKRKEIGHEHPKIEEKE